MLFAYITIFIVSCLVLAFAGNILIKTLSRIARLLGWKEFVVSFFIMSVATSVPELLIGINSALKGIPQLSFGNIIGQNIIHLTLAIAICVIILKELHIESRIVQKSALFTGFIALLPVFLLQDKILSRIDGCILILSFILYSVWLFSKKEYFSKTYEGMNENHPPFFDQFKSFCKNLGIFAFSGVLLIAASVGIVESASFFAKALSIPIVIVGVLIVSIGTALPEVYFSISAAIKRNPWMTVGNLLGATAMSASLVLGITSLIRPIVIPDLSSYVVSRIFIVLAVIFFVLFARTGRKITLKEGLFLLAIYIAFLAFELTKLF